jgi:hypothetical protein
MCERLLTLPKTFTKMRINQMCERLLTLPPEGTADCFFQSLILFQACHSHNVTYAMWGVEQSIKHLQK